jgi:hypothetical protein
MPSHTSQYALHSPILTVAAHAAERVQKAVGPRGEAHPLAILGHDACRGQRRPRVVRRVVPVEVVDEDCAGRFSLYRLKSVAYTAPAFADRELSNLLRMQITQEADTEAACWRDSSAKTFKQRVMVTQMKLFE